MRIAMYDFLGYYDICYIGGEVRNPERVLPRAIILSVILVALIYSVMNLAIISVVPWREAMKSPVHCRGVHGTNLWRLGGNNGNIADFVDIRGIRIRSDARIQPNSVCGGVGRILLFGLRQTSPYRRIPTRFVAGHRRACRSLRVL